MKLVNFQTTYSSENMIKILETFPNVLVRFKTKAGHIREMKCTRVISAVPENQKDGMSSNVLNGPAIIAVYDLINQGWRAFRKDSIISWDVLSS